MRITEELLVLVANGDGNAIQTIKDKFHARIYNIINSYRLVHEDYDDIFQEFLIRIFSNGTLKFLLLSKHPAPTQVLYSVLKQVAIDRVRYWSSEKRAYTKEEPIDVELESSLEWEYSDYAASAIDLSDLLDSFLSAEEMDLVEQIAEGDRIKDIAIRYNVSISTASRWCVNLGIKLRRLLNSHSHFP
jgi:DNA-directed RNA polymerase specialized sigma24 family protein